MKDIIIKEDFELTLTLGDIMSIQDICRHRMRVVNSDRTSAIVTGIIIILLMFTLR